MKMIHYAGDELITGDAITDAVLRYAAALARAEGSLALNIPVRFPDGRIAEATVLIGPASQLVAVPHDSEFEEVVDDALVAKINDSIDALAEPRPQTVTAQNADNWDQPADWEV
jgi:hypothetical protein